jgi:hypothetical protein
MIIGCLTEGIAERLAASKPTNPGEPGAVSSDATLHGLRGITTAVAENEDYSVERG